MALAGGRIFMVSVLNRKPMWETSLCDHATNSDYAVCGSNLLPPTVRVYKPHCGFNGRPPEIAARAAWRAFVRAVLTKVLIPSLAGNRNI